MASAGLTTIVEEPSDEVTDNDLIPNNIVIDKNRRDSIIPPSHQPKTSDTKKFSATESIHGDTEGEDDFDLFILHNFNPFSGLEDVIEWLDKTDKNFNLYKIPRNLRYASISLLVEGDAKIKYMRKKDNIKSFDDFYAFLLLNYDVTEHNTHRVQPDPSSQSSNQNNFTHNSLTHKNISFEEQQKTTTNSFDLTDNLPPRPILRSTALVDMGATRINW
jgi:hypothetical protein